MSVICVNIFGEELDTYTNPFQIHVDPSVPTYNTLEEKGRSVGAVTIGFVPSKNDVEPNGLFMPLPK
jgi:hypothetical protein